MVVMVVVRGGGLTLDRARLLLCDGGGSSSSGGGGGGGVLRVGVVGKEPAAAAVGTSVTHTMCVHIMNVYKM
jgi:hypothetical protein